MHLKKGGNAWPSQQCIFLLHNDNKGNVKVKASGLWIGLKGPHDVSYASTPREFPISELEMLGQKQQYNCNKLILKDNKNSGYIDRTNDGNDRPLCTPHAC